MNDLSNLRSNLRWNQTAILVAGTGVSSATKYNLDKSNGLAFDYSTMTVFIADRDKNRIQKFVLFNATGTTVAGDLSGPSESADGQLNQPRDVVWCDTFNTLYVADTADHRIMRLFMANISIDLVQWLKQAITVSN